MSRMLLAGTRLQKSFGGVHAVTNVTFGVREGEILGLVGDNGAGKSTLIKIISGVYRPDSGEIYWDGHPVQFASPRAARAAGIETIYQDLALAEDLDIAANIFLGKEIMRKSLLGALGFMDNTTMRTQAQRALTDLAIKEFSLRMPVRNMSGGQRQSTAITRAVYWNARLIIMDEPAAALGATERARVLELVRGMKRRGIAVILISHNVHDIVAVADRVIGMSRGVTTGEVMMKQATEDDILKLMSGKSVNSVTLRQETSIKHWMGMAGL